MWIASMTYSDREIIRSIRALRGQRVTITEIAEHAEIPLITAKRAVKRLQIANKIERTGGGRRWGSLYEVLEAEHEPDRAG
jgi:DNA-binding IclR family transcriptional regulator